MSLFGLACEGITDQITIENILCGYFDDEDLDEDIIYLQPALDLTRQKQLGFGGWQSLLQYLSSKHFRDDVLNVGHIIIQVDTDVSKDAGFDVPHINADNKELSVETLIENVTARMVGEIGKGDAEFYQKHQSKILFCITVHSIECWLLAHYQPKPPKNLKIQNCEKGLRFVLNKHHRMKEKHFVKSHDCYNTISEPFLTQKIVMKTAAIEPSMKVFVEALNGLDIAR
jgi:hypothetical protein